MSGPIVSALTEPIFHEVVLSGVTWRLRLLDPVAAAQARALIQILVGMLPDAPSEDGKRAAPREPDWVEQAKTHNLFATVLRACVVAARAPREGAEWEEVSIVLRPEEQDKKRGRVWYGALPELITDGLFRAATDHLLEARRALEPFRRPAEGAPGAGPAGDAVREEAE